MKSTIKLVLAVFLFSSVVFADGDMTNGGKTCTGSCFATTQTTEVETKSTESEDSFLTTVQEYLDSVFKYFEN